MPNITTGIFIVMAFLWGWLSDGPFRGARWPFIQAGAVITVGRSVHTPKHDCTKKANLHVLLSQLLFSILLLKMPLYTNIYGRTVVYWLSNIGVSRSGLDRARLSSVLTVFLGWCRSFDHDLDQ